METIRVRNPRSGQFDYEFSVPEPDALARRAGELRAAQQGWAAESVERRVALLRGWQEQLLAHRAEIVDALTIDTGRHLLAQAEFGGTIAAIDRWCNHAPGLIRFRHECRLSRRRAGRVRGARLAYSIVNSSSCPSL